MAFTPKHHTYVAFGAISFLPALLICKHYYPETIYATILSNSIQTPNDLSVEHKMELMRNHTSPNGGGVGPWAYPMVLHFTPHVVDTHAFALLYGLLTVCYSLISILWAKQQERVNSSLPITFDASSVGSDATSLLTDNLFWLIFTIFHIHQYLVLITITTLENVLLVGLGILLLTWALSNRMLIRYPPALVVTTLMLFTIQTKTFYDLVERNPDLWTTHFLLVTIDSMLIICHVVDDVLSTATALNCRISYLFAASLTILSSSIFLSTQPQ